MRSTASLPSIIDIDRKDRSDARLGVRLSGGKCRPVVFTKKQRSRRAHALKVKRSRLLMRVSCPKRRDNRAVDYSVDVGLAARRIPRVEVVWRDIRKKNSHLTWQISVDRIAKFRRPDFALKFDICYLPFRMYTRICSPGSVHDDIAAIQQ